jgi:hypothetical protein
MEYWSIGVLGCWGAGEIINKTNHENTKYGKHEKV